MELGFTLTGSKEDYFADLLMVWLLIGCRYKEHWILSDLNIFLLSSTSVPEDKIKYLW